MDTPYIRIEDTGELIPLRGDVTTIGRGHGVDIRLDDPSVSRLHAEIVRRGPYFYVADLGLSRNGTRVNGRPVARRVLDDGDVLTFGSARCRIEGLPREELAAEAELRRSAAPELTRSEFDVLISLCRPALSDDAFVTARHRQGDRRRPGRDRGGGQAAPAAALPEVPRARGTEPAHPAGERGHRARPGPAARRARLRAGAACAQRAQAATCWTECSDLPSDGRLRQHPGSSAPATPAAAETARRTPWRRPAPTKR